MRLFERYSVDPAPPISNKKATFLGGFFVGFFKKYPGLSVARVENSIGEIAPKTSLSRNTIRKGLLVPDGTEAK